MALTLWIFINVKLNGTHNEIKCEMEWNTQWNKMKSKEI